ncbi:MAG: leucine-rich repeat domain-containing protein, partial [Candidatus Poribacteria bacterium]|nr:leucine-rich repeat domain-containing protein [Candidatus Poribacteria bacterium]
MNFRQKVTIHVLLYFALCGASLAQVVEIPDPYLRAAIREALNLPNDSQITVQDISQLTDLRAQNTGIESLDGLEYATNLRRLWLGSNPLSDLSPISNCSKLEDLDISGCGISDIFALRGLVNLLGVNLGGNNIHDLQPLNSLKNLEHLLMYQNPISDITPLENVRKLKRLWAWSCQISDISALQNLSELTELNLAGNQIVDIAPLANLRQLTRLSLASNRIADVIPLANLTRLEWLEIQINNIADHSPLDSLSLDHFLYDQECNMPPFPLEARLENRTYPSPYAAEWTYGVDPRLDLVLGYILDDFGLRPQNDGRVVGNLEYAIQKRGELMATNPNMVFLVNISMRGEGIDHYGEDWPFWIRDANGDIVPEGITGGAGLMDFTHPAVQDIIVEQAIAVSKCGLFDGIVFDWWHETGSILADHNSGWLEGYRGLDAEQRARDVILQRIRAETRPNFLIQVNSNRGKIPRTAPFINGLTMETGIPNWLSTEDALNNALLETESTLSWAEENLREPRINGVAGQALYGEAEDSPNNRRWARVLLTLSLTHADGYAVYQTHAGFGASAWIDLFDADLGHPVGPKAQFYDSRDGLYIREFTNGWAVYNRSGEVQEITLPELATGVASGVEGTTHSLPNYDGEMYLRANPANPADVNGDGAVN